MLRSESHQLRDPSQSEPNTSKVNKVLLLENTVSFLLAKRAGKLSAALYMVTSLISDIEPLKWKLRDGSITILSDICSLNMPPVTTQEEKLTRIKILTQEITFLLQVAVAGNLISAMNAALIEKEYQIFKSGLESALNESGVTEKALLEALGGEERMKTAEEGIYKGHSHNVLYKRIKSEGSPKKRKIQTNKEKTPLGDGKPENVLGEMAKKEISKNSREEDKAERKNIILGVIKEKGEISIKDISGIIPGLSEKTIQRELSALVASNTLKKRGEKRWSRYSLA